MFLIMEIRTSTNNDVISVNHISDTITHWRLIQYSFKINRERLILAHSSRLQYTMGRKLLWQKCEISHVMSVVRKQRNMLVFNILSSFHSVQDLTPFMVSPTCRVCYLSSFKPFLETRLHTHPNVVSMVILNPVKLTVKINHHTDTNWKR